MGFGNLVSDIKSAIDLVTGAKTKYGAYPESLPEGVQTSNITNVPQYDNGNWRNSRGYTFEVVRVIDGGAVQDLKDQGWLPFNLQINPQELSQDEIFAIEVTPTFRGVVVEHHGTILKDIAINGTTGISPLRGEGGSAFSTGKPILSAGRSGYEEFHELRSYFRVYVEAKRLDSKDNRNGELRMIFRNFKDNEHLYVEPQKFTMKRSSARPFLYDYSISLKGIGVAHASNPKTPKFPEELVAFIEKAQEALDTAEKVIQGSSGIIGRFERDLSDTILNPLRSINKALQAIAGGKARLFGEFGITRRFVEQWNAEINRVSYNFKDVMGSRTPSFDKSVGWTPIVKVGASTSLVSSRQREATFNDYQIMNALKKIKVVAAGVLVQPLFDKSAAQENTFVTDAYANKFSIPEAGSSRSVTILGGDNVQTIAARELGDPDRFKDIVILNNLKPPYISLLGGPGVLKPGQKILIPQTNSATPGGVARNKEWAINQFLSEAERNLGVDIRLTPNADLAISNTGDLSLIAGVDNMAQAIATKIYLEPGSLKRHQSIGAGAGIGTKTTQKFLQLSRTRILTSLGADPRIDSIPFATILQEGNTTNIKLVVKLKSLDQPVPVPLQIKN